MIQGLPWWLSGKESTCQGRRHGFSPWIQKILWRRKWQPTSVFSPGKSHEQRSQAGYSPWGLKKSQTHLATEHTHTHTHFIQVSLMVTSCKTIVQCCRILTLIQIGWKIFLPLGFLILPFYRHIQVPPALLPFINPGNHWYTFVKFCHFKNI